MDKNLEFGMEIGLGLGMFLTDKPDINLWRHTVQWIGAHYENYLTHMV